MFKVLKWSWFMAIIVFIAGIISIQYISPDAQIAVHWNAAGEADRFAGPSEAFLAIPITHIIVLLILSFIKKLEPRAENLEKSSKAFGAITNGVSLILVLAQAMIISTAFELATISFNTLIGGIGVMFAIIGNYFGKLQSSFFIGIRTPWTLSSETVWRKTHRLAGKLFVITGLLIFILSFLIARENLQYLIIGMILPSALFPLGYSWFIWRKEQEA